MEVHAATMGLSKRSTPGAQRRAAIKEKTKKNSQASAVKNGITEAGERLGKDAKHKSLKRSLDSTVEAFADFEGPWYKFRLGPVQTAANARVYSFSTEEDVYAFVHKKGSDLLESLNSYARRLTKYDGDAGFVTFAAEKGTVTDRVNALTLLVEQSPLARVDALRSLCKWATKCCRRETLLVAESLKDLFTKHLLPPRRKLCTIAENIFLKRNLSSAASSGIQNAVENNVSAVEGKRKKLRVGNANSPEGAAVTPPLSDLCEGRPPRFSLTCTDAEILKYYYEELVKMLYASFVLTFRAGTTDTIAHCRIKYVSHALDLFKASPEQETVLLQLLCDIIMGNCGPMLQKKEILFATGGLSLVLETQPYRKEAIARLFLEEILLKIQNETIAMYKASRPLLLVGGIKYTPSKDSLDFIRHVAHLLLSIFKIALRRCQGSLGKGFFRKQRMAPSKGRRTKLTSVAEKSAGQSQTTLIDDFDSNVKLFRALIAALQRIMPFIPKEYRSALPVLELWTTLDNIVDRVSCAALKIQLVAFMLRLIFVMDEDGTISEAGDQDLIAGVSQILYKELRNFNFVQNSGRNILLRTLRGLGGFREELAVPLWRRLLQTSTHIDNGAHQINVASVFNTCARSANVVGANLYTLSEKEIIEDTLGEVQSAACDIQDLIRSHGYNANGGTPAFSRSDTAPHWELHLLTCGWALPAVAALSKCALDNSVVEVRNFVHTVEDSSDLVCGADDGQSLRSVLTLLKFAPLLPPCGEAVDPGDAEKHGSLDANGGEKKFKIGAEVIPLLREVERNIGKQADVAGTLNLLSLSYWDERSQRRHGSPFFSYEEFIYEFCVDKFTQKSQRGKCLDSGRGRDAASDSDANAIDSFLDKLMADGGDFDGFQYPDDAGSDTSSLGSDQTDDSADNSGSIGGLSDCESLPETRSPFVVD